MSKEKVLICGEVSGNFKKWIKKVESLNQKAGPFSYVFCVGDFFGENKEDWEPYAKGKLPINVVTYVLGPSRDEHQQFYTKWLDKDGQLAPNVSCLGKRGVLRTASGLKVAYISGVEKESKKKEKDEWTFNAEDVKHVRDKCLALSGVSYRGVDFLLTNQWPKDVSRLDENSVPNPPKSSSLLSWAAVQIKPRYHICSSGEIYYERRPYRNLDSGGDPSVYCTRFTALSSLKNSSQNNKWVLALNVTPVSQMNFTELAQQTTDQTDIPYSGSALSSVPGVDDSGASQFFYDMTPQGKGSKRQHDGSKKRNKQPMSFDQDKCWFCLASPDVEKHLVVSIGNEVYLALAKGGLVEDHLLILPVAHHQSTSALPKTISDEIEQYKKAITKFYSAENKVPVFFERNYKTSHLQIQVVPVPKSKSGRLKLVFEEQAEIEGFELVELPENGEIEQIAPPGTPYFLAELPNCRLYHRVTKQFPLQFGREVLASPELLSMEDRADWRNCKMSIEEETTTRQQVRTRFEPYDFTL